MKSRIQKMFKDRLENYELRCNGCIRKYRPTSLAAAHAHQNFNPGHRIIVFHVYEEGIGPLDTFTKKAGR